MLVVQLDDFARCFTVASVTVLLKHSTTLQGSGMLARLLMQISYDSDGNLTASEQVGIYYPTCRG